MDWDSEATGPLESMVAAKKAFLKHCGQYPNQDGGLMRGYVEQKLWHDAAPNEGTDVDRWLVKNLLRIELPCSSSWKDTLYAAQFERIEHKELDSYNSSRADLIAAWVDPPKEDPGKLKIDLEPKHVDPSYWLASYVLGFSDHEIKCLCNVSDPTTPARALLPLLGAAVRTMKEVKVKDETLQAYHRARYILLRYYLDATYHEPLP